MSGVAAIKPAGTAEAAEYGRSIPARNVDGAIDGHIAGGQQIDGRVQGIPVELQRRSVGDEDCGALEDAIRWQVERGVAGDVERPVGAITAGVEGLGESSEGRAGK